MSQSVNLPALGESVTEGTVTRWLKKVGDRVEVDEPLLEVSTDKVDTEIPSPVAGVIEAILVAEDETVEVGTALVTIGDGSDAASASEPEAPAAEAPAAEAPAAEVAPEQEAPAPEVSAIPETYEAPTPAEPASSFAPPAAEAPANHEPVAEGANAPAAPAAEAPAAEAPAAEAPASAAEAPAAPASAPAYSANAGYVTPLVRKLANEKGIDLGSISGTGVGGRIRKQDLFSPEVPEAPEVPAEP
ncbi:MAG: biotin/lipoyl-containing protein, partial [Lacisediminihabitans sp.]